MGLGKNLAVGILFLLLLIGVGSYAMHKTEGWNLFDSFSYVVYTISTVGSYSAVNSEAGKIVSVALIFLGMGLVLYLVTMLAKLIVEGQMREVFSSIRGGIVRMKREKDHIIICGFGKLGSYAAETLAENKKKFVIIERDLDKARKLLEHRYKVIQGDALDPVMLSRANIERASGLIAALGDDADNIYLCMNATELNPDILIASRATEEAAVHRLHKIGAQIVVQPEVVGGMQLASAILQEKTRPRKRKYGFAKPRKSKTTSRFKLRNAKFSAKAKANSKPKAKNRSKATSKAKRRSKKRR